MKTAILRQTTWILLVLAITFAAAAARAEEGDSSGEGSKGDAYNFGVALTIGEGVYFVDGEAYRGPISLEVVPSLGWDWFKFDLGLSTTLESIEIAGTDVGHWNFTFRPGGRVTPPMLPLYLRFAVPLQLQTDDFDYGIMLGVGADIPLVDVGHGTLGLVIEVDTTLTRALDFGGRGVPLEFRLGVSLHF